MDEVIYEEFSEPVIWNFIYQERSLRREYILLLMLQDLVQDVKNSSLVLDEPVKMWILRKFLHPMGEIEAMNF